ncbi:MAG: hypothetical protein H7A36_06045 [Chlamydiales bacterium]|nr:hypothetical protein [Chlamydiales bacterium]
MLAVLLATIQFITTWAATLGNFDKAVNDEIKKLEKMHENVEIGDIEVMGKGARYYGYIPYEVKEGAATHIVRQTSTWASTQKGLDRAVNEKINRLKMSTDSETQTLTIKEINVEMSANYYYAYIRYEIAQTPQKGKSVAKLKSTSGSTLSGFESAVKESVKGLKAQAAQEKKKLVVKKMDVQMTKSYYFAFITYEFTKATKGKEEDFGFTSTWAGTLSKLDSSVNNKIKNLQKSIDTTKQSLVINKIDTQMGPNNYYAFISYEVKDVPQEVRSDARLVSTWASKMSNLDTEVKKQVDRLYDSIDPTTQSLIIKDIRADMNTYYYAFISYEILNTPNKTSLMYLNSSWAGSNNKLCAEMNKQAKGIGAKFSKFFSIHNLNTKITKYWMYYFMSYRPAA